MKSKAFSADGPGDIIKAVNDWLAGETGIAIRHTETRQADPAAGLPRMQFLIWYDQEGAAT